MEINPMEMTTQQLRDALLSAPVRCATQPELFFAPEERESAAAKRMREQSARLLCARCPVRAVCFELAMRELPEHGTWGGFTADELAALATDSGEVA
ncbi:WhiB family transcriptional regulator [Nocardiopsis sediminis]|uniref:Transcriptional regulator WhiB n=1 Tax=Nocardiopsis sediminis TaxID=1778267 RepID=A0ABV8FRG1_9ACTN